MIIPVSAFAVKMAVGYEGRFLDGVVCYRLEAFRRSASRRFIASQCLSGSGGWQVRNIDGRAIGP